MPVSAAAANVECFSTHARERDVKALGVAGICPHCGNRALVRTSRQVSESFRELWGFCEHCGFRGKGHVAWDLEASPSLLPNPKVKLPRMNYDAAVEEFVAEELAGKPQTDMFTNSG